MDVVDFMSLHSSDVVLETKIFVSRRLEDRKERLGLGLKHLVLVLVLKKKCCNFSRLFKTFVVML